VGAVIDASLAIGRGETLALVGESGSGKTTLGRTLLGLNPGARGGIAFDGEPLDVAGATRSQGFRSRTTMIFQDPGGSLDPRMRLVDIVAEPLRRAGRFGAADRRRRAEQALEEVGLGGRYAGNFPHELSGGQRQRVAIARAIIAEPDLIVADEPVSALDPSVQHQVLALLAELQARHGFANLFISHDLAVVEQIADRVAVMYRGRILEIGRRDAIFDRPRHPYTIELLDAAPRVTRAGTDRFALTKVAARESSPPQGLAWFGPGDRSARLVEIEPFHWVACAAPSH
jgi:peptide/nickel transport system ATP-binding protein